MLVQQEEGWVVSYCMSVRLDVLADAAADRGMPAYPGLVPGGVSATPPSSTPCFYPTGEWADFDSQRGGDQGGPRPSSSASRSDMPPVALDAALGSTGRSHGADGRHVRLRPATGRNRRAQNLQDQVESGTQSGRAAEQCLVPPRRPPPHPPLLHSCRTANSRPLHRSNELAPLRPPFFGSICLSLQVPSLHPHGVYGHYHRRHWHRLLLQHRSIPRAMRRS
jgi:hypothetical protein